MWYSDTMLANEIPQPDHEEWAAALGHTIKGVQAHYDNPKEYRRRVDDALQKVAAEVQRIVEPGAKVIALRT